MAAIDWAGLPAPYEFDAPVTDGQYDAKVTYYENEGRGHAFEVGYAMKLVIQSGPETGTSVYDWFMDTNNGHARIKVIATTLGLTIPQTWEMDDVLGWFQNKTFTVNVLTWIAPDGQKCSRIAFDGYVAQL